MTHTSDPSIDADYAAALATASDRALSWLRGRADHAIPARATTAEVAVALGGDLPPRGAGPDHVLQILADAVEPGLMASQSPRFFGWVMGGTLPAALGADWLVAAWDQNAGMRDVTTGVVAAEEAAGRWILDLLDLPRGSDVGFTTGATTANLTGLAAARHRVLADAGWDAGAHGLTGAPAIRVFAGAERHGSVDLALRVLGLGLPLPIAVDDQGRLDAGALERALGEGAGPAIVVLQAGNIHSGAFDPFDTAVPIARRAGAWVHVDGAFGLWAAAGSSVRALMRGVSGAQSWATDAHKTLNVPYDCGISIVSDTAAVRAAMGTHASYLVETASDTATDPHQVVPELSRRARGVPVWAALRALGSEGVTDLVDGLVRRARTLAECLGALPGVRVVNDVVFTQVCIALEDDAGTRALGERLRSDGVAFASSSVWRGRDVLRFSVSNWATDATAVTETVAAVERALSPD
jgi:glutamate/tyrosine decarboxylase-like PLP-dependent enzyme